MEFPSEVGTDGTGFTNKRKSFEPSWEGKPLGTGSQTAAERRSDTETFAMVADIARTEGDRVA